jgi:hypothetical protein
MAPFINQLNIESPGWKIWILDAGTSQQVGFVDRLGFLDKLLCRALHIPERSVLEGQHGTLAEAESHMDVVFTIQDIAHRRITQAVNTQAVDQVLRLNFGPEAEGKVRLVASPIVDEKKALFAQVYQSMLGSPLGQQELAMLDMASMRDQLGLPAKPQEEVQRPGDQPALHAVPGMSTVDPRQPGGAGAPGKRFAATDADGRPVDIDGQQENPAAALANAISGMREAVGLSATALRKATAAEVNAEIERAAAETRPKPVA